MSKPLFYATYKVYINHTDAGGIVYHANHLTFFENCRRDWLTSLGFDGYFLQTDTGGDIHFVVSHADVCYKKPLLIDDKLIVSIEAVHAKTASLVLQQHIYRSQEAMNASMVASTGLITLACVGKQGDSIRPQRLPSKLLDILECVNH